MKRLTYQGTLRFPYGFHTGDGRRTGIVDQPLFREGDGRIAFAGSSLAGVLRADLERLAAESDPASAACRREPDCTCIVCRLLGPRALQSRGRTDEDNGLRASKLHIFGGTIAGEASTRVRDRVGIDRRTRTAADKRKYDVEVVDGGSEIPFELRLDEPEKEEQLYLEAFLRRLAGGWLFLGGKTASGLGRAEIGSLRRSELDLGKPDALIEYLLAEDPSAGATVTNLVAPGEEAWSGEWTLPEGAQGLPQAPGRWGQLRLRLELEFPLGFLVNDPVEALLTGLDHTFTRGPSGRPVLPGSSLRGALRSRAEQILRTLGGDRGACDLNRRGSACHEVIEQENGRRAEAREKALSPAEERARHCPACRVFGSGRLASAVKLTDFQADPSRPGVALPQELVAVDRFTGGASEGAKFNLQTRAGITMAGELHLEIAPHRLGSWGLGLLVLVLRDLLLGDLPLGFGTARGLNEYRARITRVDRFWIRPPEPVAGLELGVRAGTARWTPPPGKELDGPKAAAELVPRELRERLEEWVRALENELSSDRRGESDRETPEEGHRE